MIYVKKDIIIASIIVIALLVVASFFDLQIAGWIYNPKSSFGEFFEAAGSTPQTILQLIVPAMLFAVLFEKRRTLGIVKTIAAAVALLLVLAAALHEVVRSVKYDIKAPTVVLTAGVFFVMFLLFLAALPFAKKNPRELFITALIGLIAFTFGYTILQILKTDWGRQRFYTMDNAAKEFTQWYIPQGKGGSDKFRSFPSGHAFGAMCAVWFALWPSFIGCPKKYSRLIFALALLFCVTVMVARMIYGRHFLSDVTFGAALCLASFALTKSLVYKYFASRPLFRVPPKSLRTSDG
jgi:membrane-associated phospholipid phosphatase